MKRDSHDTRFSIVCQSCYLSFCAYDTRLAMYCPEQAGKRYGVSPEIVLQLTKATGINRRWQFMKEVKNAAVDIAGSKTD